MKKLVQPNIDNIDLICKSLKEVLESGFVAQGEYVDRFEKEISKYFGLTYALALSSGTAALDIALRLIKIQPGDEVISTALTAEPTNTSIVYNGGKVIWADIDPRNGLISPDSIEASINSRTKAIMIVHYAGMVCDMDKINQISEKYNIPIIEDAAHALGSKYNDGKFVGNSKNITIYSFQAIKTLTTIDGGMICLPNKILYDQSKRMRWFGLSKDISRIENDIVVVGSKYNMNNVNAAIGLIQLQTLEENLNKYIRNGKLFDSLFSIKPEMLVEYNLKTETNYWLYTIKSNKREEIINTLYKNGYISSELHKRNDLHTIFNISKKPLKNLDSFYSKMLHIP
jgi:dTDP-4-amino-4,6-dideoxygalactose transaminase